MSTRLQEARSRPGGMMTNPLAERAVIEAVIHHPGEAWGMLLKADCSLEWFTDRVCMAAFKAITAMVRAGQPVDLVLVTDAIGKENAEIAQEFQFAFKESTGSNILNLGNHLAVLKDKWQRRDLTWYLEDAKEQLLAGEVRPDVIMAVMNRAIHDTLLIRSAKTETPEELEQRILDGFSIARSGGGFGVEFPWPALKCHCRGLPRGKITMVAARPGEGKSTFGNQCAAHAAIDLGEPAGVWSLEMTRREWIENMVGARTGLEVKRFREGRFSDAELEVFQNTLRKYRDIRLHIDDNPYSIDQLCCSIRTAVLEKSLSLVVVDYLGHIRPDPAQRKMSIFEQVSLYSNELTNLAKEFPDTAFLIIHQLNRGSVQDGNRRPELHHLKGSGDLEQDAYMVIMVYQDPNFESGAVDNSPSIFEIAKNRGGPRGCASMTFEKSRQRFI